MNDHDNTPAALVFVAESSLAELRQHLDRLETAPSKVVPTLLKSIEATATTLSQSLKTLSVYTTDLTPEVEPNADNQPIESDRGILLAAERIGHAIECGFCERCGGIARPQGALQAEFRRTENEDDGRADILAKMAAEVVTDGE